MANATFVDGGGIVKYRKTTGVGTDGDPFVTVSEITPVTSGGLSIYRSLSVLATGQSVKASAGQLYGYYIFNGGSATAFLKFYNKATAPTVGTDTPVITIPLAAGAGANVEFTQGVAFDTGIGIGATTEVGDSGTTAPGANEVVVNLFYK